MTDRESLIQKEMERLKQMGTPMSTELGRVEWYLRLAAERTVERDEAREELARIYRDRNYSEARG